MGFTEYSAHSQDCTLTSLSVLKRPASSNVLLPLLEFFDSLLVICCDLKYFNYKRFRPFHYRFRQFLTFTRKHKDTREPGMRITYQVLTK